MGFFDVFFDRDRDLFKKFCKFKFFILMDWNVFEFSVEWEDVEEFNCCDLRLNEVVVGFYWFMCDVVVRGNVVKFGGL